MHCCGDLSHDIMANLHFIAMGFITTLAYLRNKFGRKKTVPCRCVQEGLGPVYPNAAGTSCKTFLCAKCKRETPWCEGCADDLPDLCDDCWVESHKNKEGDSDEV